MSAYVCDQHRYNRYVADVFANSILIQVLIYCGGGVVICAAVADIWCYDIFAF